MKKNHDVIIVGSGPGGMFAAHEIINKNRDIRVLIVDSGSDIPERENIMCGVGGAGAFSDGTLNLRPDIGGDMVHLTGDVDEANNIVKEVDNIFLKFGVSKKLYGVDKEGIMDLRRKAASAGITFIEIPQRHMGSDKAPEIITKFAKYLRDNGVEFLLETKVADIIIEDSRCMGIKLDNGKKLKASCVLLAPGRVGASWLDEQSRKYNIKAKFGPIDVGVRLEVPSIIMDPVVKINLDPKFHIRTEKYDDFIRTFCTNYNGFVVRENYDGMIGVNGHSLLSTKSGNTNFAFLVKISLTKPVENTIKYGESIAKLATTIGGGKPIIQRLGDLRRGRRSHPAGILKNTVSNTLKDVTPGDISMALPHRIVTDIKEGLEKLDKVIPGVAADSTLIYAPEIKFYATQIQVDRNMETNIKNLFVAGDGAGLSRDIINASATGILAGRGITAAFSLGKKMLEKRKGITS